MRKWRTRRDLKFGGRWGLSNASLVFETVNSSLNKNSWSLEISGDLQGNRRGGIGGRNRTERTRDEAPMGQVVAWGQSCEIAGSRGRRLKEE